MNIRQSGLGFVGAVVATMTLCLAMLGPRDASATEVIKIGTLAPPASPWGQVFKTWADAVSQKSGGALELQFFFGGTQGDEAAMVAKMKAGQLDGMAATAVGLGKVYKPVLALEMPGLFTTWSAMDAARDTMKQSFEKGAQDAGFTILGWGDVGAVHLLSKGFAVRTPDDVKGKKPWQWRDDDLAAAVYQVIGGVTPVPLDIPGVLPQLASGAVNIVTAPSLAAEQLQWSSKLDTINDDVSAIAIGGLIVSSKRMAALPASARAIVTQTGALAMNALMKRIRADDAAAFSRLKGKMTVVTLSADEKAKWSAIYQQTRARLAQGVFSAALVKQLEGLAK